MGNNWDFAFFTGHQSEDEDGNQVEYGVRYRAVEHQDGWAVDASVKALNSGPYPTKDAAEDAGRAASERWCLEHDIALEEVIRAKWAFDGAKTLSAAAGMLRRYADKLEQLERGGWQLADEIDDDYGHIRKGGK